MEAGITQTYRHHQFERGEKGSFEGSSSEVGVRVRSRSEVSYAGCCWSDRPYRELDLEEIKKMTLSSSAFSAGVKHITAYLFKKSASVCIYSTEKQVHGRYVCSSTQGTVRGETVRHLSGEIFPAKSGPGDLLFRPGRRRPMVPNKAPRR